MRTDLGPAARVLDASLQKVVTKAERPTARCDRMEALVEWMMELHKRRDGSRSPQGAPTVAAMSPSSQVGGEDPAA